MTKTITAAALIFHLSQGEAIRAMREDVKPTPWRWLQPNSHLYNASVWGDVILVYMWGLRGRYFLIYITIKWIKWVKNTLLGSILQVVMGNSCCQPVPFTEMQTHADMSTVIGASPVGFKLDEARTNGINRTWSKWGLSIGAAANFSKTKQSFSVAGTPSIKKC